MDYKEWVALARKAAKEWLYSDEYHQAGVLCKMAADAIETLLAERDAAVKDLAKICEENPDVCQYCKHMPCTGKHGRCIGWEWRGPQKGDVHGDLPLM